MTKEEKLELISKIGTQLDGIESYIMDLKLDNGTEISTGWLIIALSNLTGMREAMQRYEYYL